MDSINARLESLEQEMATLRRQGLVAQRRANWWRVVACGCAAAALFGLSVRPGVTASSTSISKRVKTLEKQIKALNTLFLAPNTVDGEPFVQREGNDLILTGLNLHIRNGQGSTFGGPANDPAVFGTPNGLGNLIVGYNENQGAFPRGAAHSVIIGRDHGYRGYGQLVAGWRNDARGNSASIIGGMDNRADGFVSSVSGGTQNNSFFTRSAVSGGVGNLASGDCSAASGGQSNVASGTASTIGGGLSRTAAGENDFRAGSILEDN